MFKVQSLKFPKQPTDKGKPEIDAKKAVAVALGRRQKTSFNDQNASIQRQFPSVPYNVLTPTRNAKLETTEQPVTLQRPLKLPDRFVSIYFCLKDCPLQFPVCVILDIFPVFVLEGFL